MEQIAEIEFLEIEEQQECIGIITKVLDSCFKEENLNDTNLYISIILTNSKNIKEYNKKHRNIDKETDVLSFPMFEKEEIENLVKNIIKREEVLGDVIISIEKVEKQAEEYCHSFERELSYMIVHAFYHLIGYDHITDEEKSIMRTKEEKILSKLNITRE